MKYRIKTVLAAEDHYQIRECHLLHTPEGKQTIRRERRKAALVLVVWVIAAVVFHYCTQGKINFYSTLAVFLVMEGLWQIFLVRLMKARIKRYVNRECKQEEDILELYEDGLVEMADQHRIEVEYRSLEKAVCYKNRYIFLFTNTMGFTIPCTALRDEAQVAELIAFLQSCGVKVETISK